MSVSSRVRSPWCSNKTVLWSIICGSHKVTGWIDVMSFDAMTFEARQHYVWTSRLRRDMTSILDINYQSQGRRNVSGIGGGGGAQNCYLKMPKPCRICHCNISKQYHFVYENICDFQYLLNYTPILSLLVYTDLYFVIFNSLIFGLVNIGGWGNCPPPPANPTPFQ